MTETEPQKAGGAKRVLAWLKPLVAVAILAFVATGLPWEDQLEWVPGEGDPVVEPGEVVGDWKADAIEFRLEGAPPAGFPAEARDQLGGAPGLLAVTRPAEPEEGVGRWDWKPSMQRAFGSLDPLGIAKAVACFFLMLCCGTTRWWRLLALCGCRTSWANALRLNFLGLFFNLVVPGLTGGDLVKAIVVARENPGRRAEAVVSVGVDRVLGLLVLLGLAAVVIVVVGGEFEVLRGPVLLALFAGVAGAAMYASSAVRRAVRFDALLAKLPGSRRLLQMDAALLRYARQPLELLLAVVLSLGNHAFAILGVVCIGNAFHAEPTVVDYFIIVPIANIVSALPLSPGGWGIGEYVYRELFELVGASGPLGVATSVVFRLTQSAVGLFGGLFLLLPGAKVDLKEMQQELAEGEDDPAPAA